MDTTSASLTEGSVATTRQSQPTQPGTCAILDATLARVIVEEDIVQPIARAAAERRLGSASGLLVSPPSGLALGSDAVECL